MVDEHPTVLAAQEGAKEAGINPLSISQIVNNVSAPMTCVVW